MDTELKNIIKDKCFSKNGRYDRRFNDDAFWEERYLKRLIQVTSFLDKPTIRRRIYHVVTDLYDLPVCERLCCEQHRTWRDKTHDYSRFCSASCASLSSRDKAATTNFEKYGVKNPFQSTEIKNKIKETNLGKYGYVHHMKNITVVDKVRKTCIERYGVTSPLSDPLVKQKIKQKNINKYGVENPLQSPFIRENTKRTNISKYGVENVFQSKEIMEKVRASNIERHGFYNPAYNGMDSSSYEKLLDKEWLSSCAKHLNGQQIADELGVTRSTVNRHLRIHGIVAHGKFSSMELEIIKFLQDLGISIEMQNNNIISPYELDFYLPDNDLAIECNGSYWHSEKRGKDKNYHINKTKLCEEKGIRLIHVWEHEWNAKRDIIARYIRSIIDGSDTMG
jgi:very-short-patch-repair endonuclease